MHESWQTNHNEIKEDLERFEQMENGEREYYFDVHSIENIFDFYADKNQFEKAERALQLGFRQHPNSTSLLSKKAIILMEKGDDQSAIEIMEGLINLEQSNPEFYLNLGWAYLRNGFEDKGIECFNKTIEIAFDEQEDYLLDMGLYLNQAEYYESTISFLEPACQQFPNNENLLFELAFAYDKVGDIENGLRTYNKLLEVNPFSENAWYNIGILYIKNKELETANNCYDYALALNPSHAEALFNKGNALVHLGKFEDALNCYIDYISYGYEPLLAYHYMADCLEQMENIELSVRFYRQCVQVDPDYIPAWLGYISLLINHEKNEEALEATQKSLMLSGEYSEFLYLRARALLLVNDIKGATLAFESCFNLDPDNLRNAYELLHIKIAASQRLNGDALLKKWHKRFPESAAVQYLMAAQYFLEHADFTQGAKYLNDALTSDPESYEFFIELYPEIEEIIQNNQELNQIVIKYFDYEL